MTTIAYIDRLVWRRIHYVIERGGLLPSEATRLELGYWSDGEWKPIPIEEPTDGPKPGDVIKFGGTE